MPSTSHQHHSSNRLASYFLRSKCFDAAQAALPDSCFDVKEGKRQGRKKKGKGEEERGGGTGDGS